MEERLQKVLAAAGVASRREAEKIILAGRVTVNGTTVVAMGTKVKPNDVIAVDNKKIKREAKAYYLFYKPRGVVTTLSDPQGRRTIAYFLRDIPERLFPVGRLDYNTEGLLLLTNDGELTQRLTHPSHEIIKTYQVITPGKIPDEKLDILRLGVPLEDGLTAPAVVTLLDYDKESNLTEFTIAIHEGRNRQIRRMCDFIGFPVRQLKRTKIGKNLTLAGLKRGQYRELSEAEVTELQKDGK
jgi:23S rRNA pseudouridine2605 synthase